MGRKKQEEKTAGDDGAEQGAEQVVDVDAQADELLEALTSKRAGTRVTSLAELRELLQRNVLQEFVSRRQETIGSYLAASVRKGAASEAVGACQALGLAVLTVAEEGSPLYGEARDTLVRAARDPKKKERIRAAAVEALGVSCFVSDTGGLESHTEELMTLFLSLYDVGAVTERAVTGDGGGDGRSENDDDDEESDDDKDETAAEIGLVQAAVRAWALLATTVPAARRAGLFETAGPSLRLVLESRDLGARAAAGAALAMLYEASGEADEPDLGGAAGPDPPLDVAELVEKLVAMSREGTRRRARKERREQRSIFRDIVASVEDAEPPAETLVLQHEKFEFAGWPAVIRLAALRRVLGSGLQQHFLANELLSQIFGVRAHASMRPGLRKSELKARKEDQIWEAQQRARDRADADKKARKLKNKHVLANDDE